MDGKISMNKFDTEKIERAVTMILEAIGEDPNREGLVDTPKRVAKMYEEVFAGINENPAEHFKVTFGESHEELVLVKDIQFNSFCEHHLVPFFGKVHIAYMPNGEKVVGLSKLARVVETIAKRPQLQERITTEVADLIMSELAANGAMVVVEAEHMCMTIRGVKKPGTLTVTSAVRGVIKNTPAIRQEVLSLIKY